MNVGGGTVSGGTIVNEGVWNIGDGQGINNNGGQTEFQNLAGSVVNKITTPGGQAVNWSAEDGPGSTDGGIVASIPGWSRTSNFTVVQYGSPGFPTVAQAPPGAGTNFFAGGPDHRAVDADSEHRHQSVCGRNRRRGFHDDARRLPRGLRGRERQHDCQGGLPERRDRAREPHARAGACRRPRERDRLRLPLRAEHGSSGHANGAARADRDQGLDRGACGTNYNNAYSDNIKIQFRDSNAYIGSSYIGIPFDNDSTASGGGVHLQHGTLNLSSGGLSSNTGSFAVDDGGALQFGGGTHTLGAASTVTGPGAVRFSGGSVIEAGTYNPARTQIDGGTATFNAPASTTVLNQSSGVLSGSSTFTINGPTPASSWSGGTMTGTGTTWLLAGATMNLSGPLAPLS